MTFSAVPTGLGILPWTARLPSSELLGYDHTSLRDGRLHGDSYEDHAEASTASAAALPEAAARASRISPSTSSSTWLDGS